MRSTWIATIVVVVLAAGIAAYYAASVGSTASNSGVSTPGVQSSSPGSSVASSGSSAGVQPANQTAGQYPLVWGPNPPSVCYEDEMNFCVAATFGFSNNASSYSDISTPVTSTTEIQPGTTSNETFIVRGITTTVIRTGQTFSSNLVIVLALVQDAVTGQNASQMAFAAGSCVIPPTGLVSCLAYSHFMPSVPPGHPYKVTVFAEGSSSLPCISEPCPQNTIAQAWPRLSAPETIIVPAGTWGTTNNSSTTQSSTTTISSILGYPVDCEGGGMNTTSNTAPKPTVYVKVVTGQGTVITNGSLIVSQLENMTNGYETSHYCISLSDVQGSGYVRLADLNQSGSSASIITGGYYNVTLVAGLNNQGLWYMATIPLIPISPNSIVYVTVSVPSGTVTIVTTSGGSGAVTTTTTSATTINNGG